MNNESPSKIPKRNKKFKCPYCDYENDKESNLKSHYGRRHDLEKLVKFEDLEFDKFLNKFNWTRETKKAMMDFSRELFTKIKKESTRYSMVYTLFKPKYVENLVESLVYLTCKLNFCAIKIAKEFDLRLNSRNKQLFDLVKKLGFLKKYSTSSSEMLNKSLSILKNTMLKHAIGDKISWEGYVALIMEKLTKLASEILDLINIDGIINPVAKRGMIWGILYLIITEIKYKKIRLYFIEESSKINISTLRTYREKVNECLEKSLLEIGLLIDEFFNIDKHYIEFE